MNRRELVTGLSALITYGCSCSAGAGATAGIEGCRAASAGSAGLEGRVILPDASDKKGSGWRGFALRTSSQFRETFNVRPGLCFYHDEASPNALAIPQQVVPDGPDGTVLLGLRLFGTILSKYDAELRGTNLFEGDNLRKMLSTVQANVVVIAHEFGHIVQFHRGFAPPGPWQVEPHADFLAGWYVGRQNKHTPGESFDTNGIKDAAQTMFQLGDTGFNDPTHHGEPAFRAAMVYAGYEAAGLDLQVAFDTGLRMVGLR